MTSVLSTPSAMSVTFTAIVVVVAFCWMSGGLVVVITFGWLEFVVGCCASVETVTLMGEVPSIVPGLSTEHGARSHIGPFFKASF